MLHSKEYYPWLTCSNTPDSPLGQDNLHSGPWSPVSLAASDITALLPADEQDFAEGREPRTRAALEDTPPATENPDLIFDPRRSLFATLIQTHHLWGKVSRRAVRQDKSSRPWDTQSEYAQLKEKLDRWERSVPLEYRWDPRAMSDYKAEKLDLVGIQSYGLKNHQLMLQTRHI